MGNYENLASERLDSLVGMVCPAPVKILELKKDENLTALTNILGDCDLPKESVIMAYQEEIMWGSYLALKDFVKMKLGGSMQSVLV